MGMGSLAFWSGAAKGAGQELDKLFERDFQKQVLKFKKEQANLEMMLAKEKQRKEDEQFDFLKAVETSKVLGQQAESLQTILAQMSPTSKDYPTFLQQFQNLQRAQMAVLAPTLEKLGIKQAPAPSMTGGGMTASGVEKEEKSTAEKKGLDESVDKSIDSLLNVWDSLSELVSPKTQMWYRHKKNRNLISPEKFRMLPAARQSEYEEIDPGHFLRRGGEGH